MYTDIHSHAVITAQRSLFVARYSFIQLRKLRQREVNQIARTSKRLHQDSNPGSFNGWKPKVLITHFLKNSFIVGH